MSNYESLAILIFIGLIVYIFDRKNFKREGIVFLRRTEKGLKMIDSIAKRYPRMITFLADVGIVFSFGLMGARYLLIEKNAPRMKRIRLYLIYTLISSLFIYTIYDIFFVGIIEAFKIPVIYSNPVLFLLVAFTYLFGVSGYGFMTLFFGAITFSGAIKLVLPIDLSDGSGTAPQDSPVPIFYVPIVEWLISILFILVVHEFSHAIVARVEGIRVKSLGYGFFGPMPLGFAEPDEKEIKKSRSLTKTRIFGAGSFSNILAAVIIFISYALIIAAGISFGTIQFEDNGVYIRSVNSSMPAGILPNSTLITAVDGENITDIPAFVRKMNEKGPGENVTLLVNGTEYKLTLVADPQNKTRGIIGIVVMQNRDISKMPFMASLINWLIMLNIGIALANLFPLRPLDGGLMLEEVLAGAGIKNKKETAQMISKFTLALLLFSLLMPWLVSIFT